MLALRGSGAFKGSSGYARPVRPPRPQQILAKTLEITTFTKIMMPCLQREGRSHHATVAMFVKPYPMAHDIMTYKIKYYCSPNSACHYGHYGVLADQRVREGLPGLLGVPPAKNVAKLLKSKTLEISTFTKKVMLQPCICLASS